jgi:hypothetical protein
MNISIVINTYIDVDESIANPFDHPTSLDRFEDENTLSATLDSINKLNVDNKDKIKIVLFAIATHKSCEFDSEIRSKIKICSRGLLHESLIYTNSDINELNKNLRSPFLSVCGYPEIRNLGFIIPIVLGDDVIVQIDDDELMRPDYLFKMKEILNKNSDKYLFTAPYEKNGTVRINSEDTLESWGKFSSMAEDMENFYFKSDCLKETLFGFGGNMIIKKEFAEKVFYPLNVPRGEDFSMLLAARLVYENGNVYADINEKNELYKAYFAPYKELTIIHKPPHEAKADFLKYFENNMKRFIMEWDIYSKQRKLTKSKLKELSEYIYRMIGYEDIKVYILKIIAEMNNIFDNKQVEYISKRLMDDIDHYKTFDRLDEYMKMQSEYIKFIKNISVDLWYKKILYMGKT